MSATRSSRGKHWDVQRIALAVASPGIDTRTWTTAARVEEVEWDPALGWVVHVRAYGSQLEGAPLTCRQASSLAGVGAGEYLPMAKDAEVLVSLPAGSVEDFEPLVVGGLTNEEDNAPTEINGLPINGELAASSPAAVSPRDTEIKVSPHSRREEYAGQHVDQALAHVLKATQPAAGVQLGSELAADSFLKGEATVEKLIQIIDQLVTLLGTGATAPGGGPVTFAGLAAFQLFWTAPPAGMKVQLQVPGVVLSIKVKGE